MDTPFLRTFVGGVGVMIFMVACQPTVDCTHIEYLPAPPAVQTGPPPGDPPEMPPFEFQQPCDPPAPRLRVGRWCYDQEKQVGGATLTTSGVAFGPQASINSVDGADVTCEEGYSSPLACWGPEGAPFDARVCTTCQQQETIVASPECAPAYARDGGLCVFPGLPGGSLSCPPGWSLNADGYCETHVFPSPECPAGYEFDPAEQCCIAQYLEPIVDPGIPSRTYSACPEGMEYDGASDTCVGIYSLEYADCQVFSEALGYCSGGRNGQACVQRTCSQGAWDPQACCCMSLTGAGCLP